MNILDLDLDCFITGIAHFTNDMSDRLDDQAHFPWSEEDFRNFLEDQCGLSRDRKIRGRVFNEHVSAFRYWQELIERGQLDTPFELTHVDAHSDMGINGWAYAHICYELLFLPPSERIAAGQQPKHLDSGNFLAYVLALQWVNRMSFVHHQDYLDNDDFVGIWFKDFNPFSGVIQLKGFENPENPLPLLHREPAVLDPEIPFELVRVDQYRHSASFDIATISQSPGFTPASADMLLDVFQDYIEEI